MTNKLEIKFKNQKQTFEILNDEIMVSLYTSKHKLKYNIPLSEIKNTWYISNGSMDYETIRIYTSLFFNVFSILLIITLTNNAPQLAIVVMSVLLVLPFIFMFIKSSQIYEEKHIHSSKLFYFIYTKKNAAEVDDFIKLIYKKQVEYYRKEYFLVDPILSYDEQYERYIWLYKNKYINENEFEVIKEDLDNLINLNKK